MSVELFVITLDADFFDRDEFARIHARTWGFLFCSFPSIWSSQIFFPEGPSAAL
jgi:hypothetical protein